MNRDLIEKLIDSGARIAAMWPMFGLTEIPSDIFTDAIEYLDLPEGLTKYIPDFDQETTDVEDIDWEDVISRALLKGDYGWLVLVNVPVYEVCGSGVSYSWGHFRHRLYYGETPEKCIEAAIAFEREQMTAAKAKCVAEGGAS